MSNLNEVTNYQVVCAVKTFGLTTAQAVDYQLVQMRNVLEEYEQSRTKAPQPASQPVMQQAIHAPYASSSFELTPRGYAKVTFYFAELVVAQRWHQTIVRSSSAIAQAVQPAEPLTDFDLRGLLAAELLCWHRLTGAEADNLLAFARAHNIKPKEAQP